MVSPARESPKELPRWNWDFKWKTLKHEDHWDEELDELERNLGIVESHLRLYDSGALLPDPVLYRIIDAASRLLAGAGVYVP
jgi:hypothetical protein